MRPEEAEEKDNELMFMHPTSPNHFQHLVRAPSSSSSSSSLSLPFIPPDSRPSPTEVPQATFQPQDWVRWEEVDRIQPGEEKKYEILAASVRRIMERNFVKHGRFMRGAHVKGHAFLRGTLTVSPGLPSYLQHGLFSTPGKSFTTVARFSNESSHIQDDKETGQRGFGLKVLEVEGRMMNGKDHGSQDFLFNNSRTSELFSLDAAVDVFSLRDRFFDDPDGLELALRSRPDAEKILSPPDLPNTHIVAAKLYQQTPMQYGPYVAKLSLLPASNPQLAIAAKSRALPPTADATAHRKLLRAYHHQYPSVYIVRAQFACRGRAYSLEDTSIPWDAPWVELGRLDFPIQESCSDQRRVWFEETLALSPAVGLLAHAPAGSLARARKWAYEESRRIRAERNVEIVDVDISPAAIPD
ncbi:hypothetical protein T439DRAFT_384065 [Meredithblackwellia eburnea MCA 4105]